MRHYAYMPFFHRPYNEAIASSCLNVATVRGVGTAGATGPLASAMLKPRGREYLFAPAIFPHIFACCSLNFHSLSLCRLHTVKTWHSVDTTGRILRNKLTKHTSSARISRIEWRSNTYVSRTSLKLYSHKMFAPAMSKSFRRLWLRPWPVNKRTANAWCTERSFMSWNAIYICCTCAH